MKPGHFIRYVALAAGSLLASAQAHAQVRDVELKAAYIYNFAQFTVWPDNLRARDVFSVCASPDSALWSSLLSFNGKPVNGSSWSTVDAAGRTRPGDCQVLVLARSAERPALAAGVLVVRDGPGRGAAITLVDGGEHIRFDVDTEEATRSGLRFSSKLLRLARNVL